MHYSTTFPSLIPMVPLKISQIGKPSLRFSAPARTVPLSIPFKHSGFTDDIHCERYAQKMKAFKHLLTKVGEDPFEGLAIIDAVQRLGIDYHFQDEIHKILLRQYIIFTTYNSFENGGDLSRVALLFRLLRQHGYHVTSDVFNKFRNKQGKFSKKVSEDIDGLMALYEASHLSIDGDYVLDEAGDFCVKLLTERMKNLDDYEARIVGNTLAHPCHKSLARFMAKKNLFLSKYPSDNGWIHVFEDLAKLDFNLVQSLHKKEMVQISKWWKELGLAKNLKFARDQPIKWYICSMTSLMEPSLSWQRVEVTKPISLIYIIDDIFDVHGTLDELTLFTEIINRWDLGAIDQLPDYMRICFKALDDITNEISCKVLKEHGYNPVKSLQKVVYQLTSYIFIY